MNDCLFDSHLSELHKPRWRGAHFSNPALGKRRAHPAPGWLVPTISLPIQQYEEYPGVTSMVLVMVAPMTGMSRV